MVAEPPFCSDTGWACDPVWEATGNETIARVIGWLSEKPLQIAGILALAYLANRVLRSMIARTGRRMAENADRLGGYMPDGLRTREVDGRAVARAATMSTITRSRPSRTCPSPHSGQRVKVRSRNCGNLALM